MKHIISTKGLIEIIIDKLFLDDPQCLYETCRYDRFLTPTFLVNFGIGIYLVPFLFVEYQIDMISSISLFYAFLLFLLFSFSVFIMHNFIAKEELC